MESEDISPQAMKGGRAARPSLKFSAAGASDAGRVVEHNEDYGLIRFEPGLGYLAIVADGLGAQGHGDVASETAAETVSDFVFVSLSRLLDQDRADLPGILREAFVEANRRVIERAARDPELAGVSTTLLAFFARGSEAFIANVGNCRAYRIADGSIDQLTWDHTVGAEMIREGLFERTSAMVQRYRNTLTRSIGKDLFLEADISPVEIHPGDRLVLCSDGLHGLVDDHEIAGLASQMSPDYVVDQLVDLAQSRGGTDNVTAVVIEAGADTPFNLETAASGPAT